MRKIVPALFLFIILFFSCPSAVFSQTSGSDTASSQFDMTGFPQWSKDFRRMEIIAFGSFPIMYLFTNQIMKLIINRGFSGSNHITAHTYRAIGIAAGCSILLSLVDYSIVLHKRKREERQMRSLPPGTTIIIRRPMDGDESDAPPAESELYDSYFDDEDF